MSNDSNKLDDLDSKTNNISDAPNPVSSEPAYESILANIRNNVAHGQSSSPKITSLRFNDSPRTTFQELLNNERVRGRKIENDRKQTENKLIESNQALKKLTLILLFILLGAESLVLFILAFLQGFKLYGFTLDDITLRILVVATLVQISAMLTIAVRHLFPAINHKSGN